MTVRAARKRIDPDKVIRSDSRGRVPLGRSATDKDFRIEYHDDGSIILTPVVFIPESEAWLYRNDDAIAQVRAGLADAAQGRVQEAGSFAEYTDVEID